MYECHNILKNPGRRKKPGDRQEGEGNEGDGESEEDTRVYNSIINQESSKLNSCERNTCSWLVVIIAVSAILLCS